MNPITNEPRRILLKLSGELLSSDHTNFNRHAIDKIVSSIQATIQDGICEMAIVIGGGNLFRGREAQKLDMTPYVADRIGMLSTCMNALVLQEFLKKAGLSSFVMADALTHPCIEPFNPFRAQALLEQKHILLFANGLAQPFFTTDTASVVRAREIEADVLVKATKVPGVYDKDPALYSNAKRYTSLTFATALKNKIEVMDDTAFCLLQRANLPLFVYRFGTPHSIKEALHTPESGTWVVPDNVSLD